MQFKSLALAMVLLTEQGRGCGVLEKLAWYIPELTAGHKMEQTSIRI